MVLIPFVFAGLVAVGFVIFVFTFFGPDRRLDSFKANCVTAGGHIYNPAITLCLGEGGQVLEVYP